MAAHIQLGINGVGGRMGRRVLALALADRDIEVALGIEAAGSPLAGGDIDGVPIKDGVPPDVALDAVIDFSAPAGTMAILPACVERKIPLVIATTGFSPEQRDDILAAAHTTAVLMSPNMSLVVNVLFELTRRTGGVLAGKGFDVEVIERHHRFKKDAPSGTAMHFARILQESMGLDRLQHGREGLTGERPAGEIGMHAIRAGDNVGEHTIVFSTLGETLELVHKGTSRDSYAAGAVQAAKFLAGKPAGQYSMNDVLGLARPTP